MKKSDIKSITQQAEEMRLVYTAYFTYEGWYSNLLPLKSSERLFLSCKDEDFHLNGYVILRFRDIKKVHIKEDKYNEIMRLEHVLESVTIPVIDLTDWQTVFLSLQAQGRCVIVENEKAAPKETRFIIGKIHKARKRSVSLLHFDADGTWQEELFQFDYSLITTVRFGERYTDIFSKHLEAPPISTSQTKGTTGLR